ncbi:MAG TPA: S8/S53 family peptidase [Candidatus Binatia bacterium]|nr:S8/S53 family peptidase [Candidatus Binatia bacterium]
MRRAACAALLLGIALHAGPGGARSPARKCQKACRQRIVECAQIGKRRKCRGAILRGCKREGLAYCGFGFHLDAGIAPANTTLPAGDPLAAVAVAGGTPAVFVADQLAVQPHDRAELDDLLARTGGTVLTDDTVPPRPDGQPLPPEVARPATYLVKVDPGKVDLLGFAGDAIHVGVSGSFAVSSMAGAKLLALATHELAAGRRVGANFVLEGSYLSSTQEAPKKGGGYDDAFATPQFGPTGSKANVPKAWQLVTAKPPPRRARVAIIDGGFWLDESTGDPLSVAGGASDLPSTPWQAAFNCSFPFACGVGANAGGVNPSSCTGGSTCHWHGNGAAGVALGILNNRYGAAGTGGLVADPILIRRDGDGFYTGAAIRTAVAWGADVISMSFGTECDNSFCDLGMEAVGLYPAERYAAEQGVVMVAAAGNGADVGGGDFVGFNTHSVPCRNDHVICVGALADGANTAIRYSNWGPFVDIWAPTNIPVMPDGDNASVHSFGGTSAATPFVAGIAAMLRAYDGSLTSDDVDGILWQTGWHDSADPHVDGYVNAFAAVHKVAGTAPPEITVLAPKQNATVDINNLGGTPFQAQANDLEDGPNCCTITWFSLKDGPMGEGKSITYQFPDLGVRLITATAEDSEGGTTSVNFAINVVESPPDVVIDQPTPSAQVFEDTLVTLSGRDLGLGICQFHPQNGHWTSDGKSDSVPQSGCTVSATFHGTGPRLLTFTVIGPHGTPGSTSVAVTVVPKPAVFASIVAPTANQGFNVDNCDQILLEADAGGQNPLTYGWVWQADGLGCAPFTITPVCPITSLACISAPPPMVTFLSFWDTCAQRPPCTGSGQLELQITDALSQNAAATPVPISLLVNPH